MATRPLFGSLLAKRKIAMEAMAANTSENRVDNSLVNREVGEVEETLTGPG